MSRCMMIVNPTSGREKAKYYKDDLYAQLQTMFDEVELRETRRSGDAANWAKEASNNNYEAVFSMGGERFGTGFKYPLAAGRCYRHVTGLQVGKSGYRSS